MSNVQPSVAQSLLVAAIDLVVFAPEERPLTGNIRITTEPVIAPKLLCFVRSLGWIDLGQSTSVRDD